MLGLGCRRACGTIPVDDGLPDAGGRAARRDRARPRGRRPPDRRGGHRGHGRHRRDRSAGRARGPLRATKACGSTSTPPTAGRRCSPTTCARRSPGSSARTRSRSIRTSGSTRRTRAGASLVRDLEVLPRSFDAVRHLHACRTRSEPATASTWAATARSSAAGSGRCRCGSRCWRTGAMRTRAHLPRRGAGPVPGRARRGAARLRAARPGRTVDLLLPLRAAGAAPTGRRRAEAYLSTLNQRLMTEAPARRPRLLLQRHPRRPLRAAGMHRELPDRGRRSRRRARRRGRDRERGSTRAAARLARRTA